MHSQKAEKAVKSGGKNHGLGAKGLLAVIEKLDTPDYIVYEYKGEHAGRYAAVLELNKDTVAILEFVGYRSGPNATVNGEDGYYDVLITAYDSLPKKSSFKSFEEYILKLIDADNDSCEVVYNRAEEKEASEPVALRNTLSRQTSETSDTQKHPEEPPAVFTDMVKGRRWAQGMLLLIR